MPTLAPGDIVILDNLGSHKGQRARRAIRQARRIPAVPAALQPGPEPDRAALCQAQGTAQSRCRANHRPVGQDRQSHRLLHPKRMRQLLRRGRIRRNLIRNGSKNQVGKTNRSKSSTHAQGPLNVFERTFDSDSCRCAVRRGARTRALLRSRICRRLRFFSSPNSIVPRVEFALRQRFVQDARKIGFNSADN